MKPIRGLFRWNPDTRKMEPVKKAKKIQVHELITDEMEPMESYADINKPVFTSKSAYRRHLRSKGYVETGGDHLNERPESQEVQDKRHEEEVRQDVERAYFDVKYDRIQFSDREKELHLREQRRLGKAWTLKAPY